MARKRYAPEQIIHLLREAEIRIHQGTSVAETCRQIGVNIQTYYRWRREYGGMEIDQLRRLEALGHVLQRRTTYGGVGGGQGILFDAVTGVMMGGSTPHKDGAAVAW